MGLGKILFVQAEDGIRGLVRSRVLGDVYKRQLFLRAGGERVQVGDDEVAFVVILQRHAVLQAADIMAPVSYTHLTLPTIYSV